MPCGCVACLASPLTQLCRYLNDLVAAVPDLHLQLPKKKDMVVADSEGAPEVDTDKLSKWVAAALPLPPPPLTLTLRSPLPSLHLSIPRPYLRTGSGWLRVLPLLSLVTPSW